MNVMCMPMNLTLCTADHALRAMSAIDQNRDQQSQKPFYKGKGRGKNFQRDSDTKPYCRRYWQPGSRQRHSRTFLFFPKPISLFSRVAHSRESFFLEKCTFHFKMHVGYKKTWIIIALYMYDMLNPRMLMPLNISCFTLLQASSAEFFWFPKRQEI